MTAILGVFGCDGAPPLSEVAEGRMLGAMVRRGASQAGVWRQGSAVLAVARQGWEFGPG